MTRNIITLCVYYGIVYSLLGCASSPQRISPDQMTEIEEAITDRLYSAMHDRSDCDIVDRIESGGPGQPRFVVFEDNRAVPVADLPYFVRESVREGSAICVERVPKIADLWEPHELFDCIESGRDIQTCMSDG